MKKKRKTKNAGETAIGIGAGLVAAGAAAAGYYFYGSPKAKIHRRVGAKWAMHMKNDVIREAKNLKELDSKAITDIVNDVAKKYQTTRSASASDLKRAAQELKANWKKLELETKRTIRKNVFHMKGEGKRTA